MLGNVVIKSIINGTIVSDVSRSSCWQVYEEFTPPEKLFQLEKNDAKPVKGRCEALPRCRYWSKCARLCALMNASHKSSLNDPS